MIELTVGTNLNRKRKAYSGDKTPKQVFEAEGIDYNRGAVHLDGSSLSATEMNTPLSTLLNGATSATLTVTVKADAAA